jgi:outer membrane murein-binding lipoprotein Lpp
MANPTQDQVADAFQALYDQLVLAYHAASDDNTRDRINGIKEIVYDQLIQLEQQQLDANNALYGQVKGQMQKVIARIEQLKSDINSIIHAVNVATDVAAAADMAIGLAAKYFKM